MIKFGQFIMGPAGSGKSTYCLEIYKHITKIDIFPQIINLDPSLDNIEYPEAIDIRKLINTNEVMEEFHLGPNGALIFCIEYLANNLRWIEDEISLSSNNYFIFDLPGQIELYFHDTLIKELLSYLQNNCVLKIVGLFIIDCQFIIDIEKFFSGTIVALACMLFLDILHYNILNKVDLLKNMSKKILEKFLYPTSKIFIQQLKTTRKRKNRKLVSKLSKLLENFSMIYYIPLDTSCPDRMNWLLQLVNYSCETRI